MEQENQQYNNQFGAKRTETSVMRKDDTICVLPGIGSLRDKVDYYIDDYHGLQLDSN